MGNAQSPSNNDPRYVSAARAFTQKELEDLRSLFNHLAAQSQNNAKCISPPVFQSYFGLHGPLGERMFDLVTQERKDQRLTFEDLVVAKATYEKGTKDEIEEFIFRLLDVSGDNFITRSDLKIVMIAIFNNILCIKDSQDRSSSHEDIVNIFLNAAKFSMHNEGGTEETMSFEDFRNWCTHLPSVKKLLGSLLLPPGSGRPGSQIPKLLTSTAIDSNIILLRKEYAWHIGGALSQHDLEDWKLLYHSSVNGLSFNTFLGNISGDFELLGLFTITTSPVYLNIEVLQALCAGCTATSFSAFNAVYSLESVHLRYLKYCKHSCAINFTSEDIPNGIGFGGRVNHFGLFVSANFDQGHTFSCTTFGSPCLSKTNRILPEVIECWGVTQVATQDKHDAVKGTVLERFKEDRNMLKMVGLANSSE
ncbi:hypothetical protein V8G54_020768 [Vigna mungo]|uniref:EF-hand domain-containing protein n=1 Tax=Vigna mungo TaxID=3915 RepID=A0AAQ3ND27_VIGMU